MLSCAMLRIFSVPMFSWEVALVDCQTIKIISLSFEASSMLSSIDWCSRSRNTHNVIG